MSAILWLILLAHWPAPSNLSAPPAPSPPAATSADVARVQRDAWVMGTRARIVAEDAVPERASRTAEAMLRELERFDALLSTWDPDSPLTRLNQTAPGEPVRVDPELASLLEEAHAWSGRTEGAFEPAIGALVDAWDLRGAGRSPTADEIARALTATGGKGLGLENGRLVRSHAAAWIDSGGFGKGAALRSAARDVLHPTAGPSSRVLVDLGGQVLALAPADAPWRVQVAHPSDRRRPVLTLVVSDGSVATSGASERGRHVIDPRTGRRVEAWGSVTVFHTDPFAADVLSTALFVMGPHAGLDFAERTGVAALFLTEEAGHLSATKTSHLTSHLTSPLVAASDASPSILHPHRRQAAP